MAFPLPIPIPNYDPNLSLEELRSVGTILQSGSVTPSDTNGYTTPDANGVNQFTRARFLYLGVSGDVTVVKWDLTTQLYTNVAAGVFHPISTVGVMSTGTSPSLEIIWGN